MAVVTVRLVGVRVMREFSLVGFMRVVGTRLFGVSHFGGSDRITKILFHVCLPAELMWIRCASISRRFVGARKYGNMAP